MNAPVSQILSGLDVLERRLTPHHLIKSGAFTKESEAKYLLELLRDARIFIEDSRDNR